MTLINLTNKVNVINLIYTAKLDIQKQKMMVILQKLTVSL